MITIEKDIKITIDKADVPVLSDICKMARSYKNGWMIHEEEYSEERIQEIHKFLRIIFDKV